MKLFEATMFQQPTPAQLQAQMLVILAFCLLVGASFLGQSIRRTAQTSRRDDAWFKVCCVLYDYRTLLGSGIIVVLGFAIICASRH